MTTARKEETSLTGPHLQRLEREVVKGFKAYWYNGSEGLEVDCVSHPDALHLWGCRSTFVRLTNGTSHGCSESTNPFLMMQGKFQRPGYHGALDAGLCPTRHVQLSNCAARRVDRRPFEVCS